MLTPYACTGLPLEPASAILRPSMLWACNFCAQLSHTARLDVPPAQKNFGTTPSSGTARVIGGAFEGRPSQSKISRSKHLEQSKHHGALNQACIRFFRRNGCAAPDILNSVQIHLD